MGRKKSSVKSKPVFRPFCYYCDRDFDNEKVLIQHQKLKHFQCLYCHRKADTGPGLINHVLQVHKDAVKVVPNSLPGRDDPDLVIHGMSGIPPVLLIEKAKGTSLEDEMKKQRMNEAAAQMAGPQVFPHMFMPPLFPQGMMPPHSMLPVGFPFVRPPAPPDTS